MLEEITQLIGLHVYTNNGVFLGGISNVIIDVATNKTESIYVDNTNPALVESGRPVTVPFRWIQSVGDIIILKHFPSRVELSPEERAMLMAYEMESAELVEPM